MKRPVFLDECFSRWGPGIRRGPYTGICEAITAAAQRMAGREFIVRKDRCVGLLESNSVGKARSISLRLFDRSGESRRRFHDLYLALSRTDGYGNRVPLYKERRIGMELV